MEKQNLLILKEERPTLLGPLNEVAGIATWEKYTLRYSENLTNNNGEPYSSGSAAVRFGLPKVTVPFVKGWVAGEMNPADRATVAKGTHRLSVYHKDHSGNIVNTMFEHAYKNRLTSVELTVGIREVCDCGLEGCFVHPVEQTGGGAVQLGSNNRNGDHAAIHSGVFIETGDIAPLYGNKYDAGTPNGRIGIIGLINGVPYIIGWYTARKRGGMGAKGQKNPQFLRYRYATTCECGLKTCFGLCVEDSHLRFIICNTMKGRTVLALDPRGNDSMADVRAALEAQVGVESIVITNYPFECGGDF
jgi:hypothetical protein